MKQPSPTTELRNLRRAVKEEHKAAFEARRAEVIWRGRATKAEQEAAEWEKRFDALFAWVQSLPPSSPGAPKPQ